MVALMKAAPKIGFLHNPIIELEEARLSRLEAIKAKEKEKFEKYIPKVRGIHPLPLIEEYKSYWEEFVEQHKAIDITPTRRYYGIFKGYHNNAKRSYGVVKVFCPFREDDYKRSRVEATFRREFEFKKPSYSSEKFITLLELYVRTLRSISPNQRQTIANDFYLIVKAIRMRPKVHRKLIDMAQFSKLVMSYFLLVDQPYLALYTAIRVMPKAIPGSIDRWCMLKLLKLPEILVGEDGTANSLNALQDIDSTKPHNNAALDFDYRVNVMTRSILEYYYARPNVVITDRELFGLMRCFMSRLQAKELMDLLPLVLKRLVNGLPAELPEADSVELFFEDHGSRDPATFEQIVATYALAFVNVGCKDMAIKFLQTVANMPSTPLSDYGGLTVSLVRSLIEIAEHVPEKSPIIIMHLTQIANGPYYKATRFMKAVEYKAKIADDIIEYMTTGQIRLAVMTTYLLSFLSKKLSFFTSFAILQRLEKISEPLAYEWLGGVTSSIRASCIHELINWCTRKMVNDRSHFMDQLQIVTKRSPLFAVKIYTYMNKTMHDYEADRKYLLARAFIDISETKDTAAMGSFLALVARGPKSLIRSYRGHQSAFQRTHMTVQFLKRIDTDAIDVPDLTPYLFYVSALLKSQGADRLIWREVLRNGIEPNTTAIQTSLRRRLMNRSDIRQSAELMAVLIRKLKPNGGQIADFDEEGAALAEEDEWAELPVSASKGSSSEVADLSNMVMTTRSSRKLYTALIDGLNHAGFHELVNLVAIYILTRPFCDQHTLRIVASVWLDSVGYDPEATSEEVYCVWEAIKKYANLLRRERAGSTVCEYSLNLNNFHSLIEAIVRKGDLNMAWRVIHEEMPKHDYIPDKRTFYMLISQLSVNGRLWPLGKAMVARFNKHYPGPVAAALKDPDCPHTLKAMIYAGIQESGEN
ncbi:hypothetical protein GGI15_000632 [Coemansia interrupta]|uniref:Uncharacterized protein n=1 Tax=Coemansia interrupta TaxID=1126814 RepID=A0A9W8LNB5_9FUNG|nr:hypothetical protein GGI15_000632 [Coemansia interrupta]